jgi:hypothetical protein
MGARGATTRRFWCFWADGLDEERELPSDVDADRAVLARRSPGGGDLALFFGHVFLDAADQHHLVFLEHGMNPFAPELARRIDDIVRGCT